MKKSVVAILITLAIAAAVLFSSCSKRYSYSLQIDDPVIPTASLTAPIQTTVPAPTESTAPVTDDSGETVPETTTRVNTGELSPEELAAEQNMG